MSTHSTGTVHTHSHRHLSVPLDRRAHIRSFARLAACRIRFQYSVSCMCFVHAHAHIRNERTLRAGARAQMPKTQDAPDHGDDGLGTGSPLLCYDLRSFCFWNKSQPLVVQTDSRDAEKLRFQHRSVSMKSIAHTLRLAVCVCATRLPCVHCFLRITQLFGVREIPTIDAVAYVHSGSRFAHAPKQQHWTDTTKTRLRREWSNTKRVEACITIGHGRRTFEPTLAAADRRWCRFAIVMFMPESGVCVFFDFGAQQNKHRSFGKDQPCLSCSNTNKMRIQIDSLCLAAFVAIAAQ